MQGGASSSGGPGSLGQQVRQMGAPPGGGGGGSSAKRGKGPLGGTVRVGMRPKSVGANNAGGNASSAFKTTDVMPAAMRKKQKVAERRIPDKVAAVLPEGAVYTELVEFEARVDAALARKKLDIQEVMRLPPPVERVLRIHISNTFDNQTQNPNPPFQQHCAEPPPSWTLRIMGYVLESDDAEPVDGNGPKLANPSLPKMSSFFKRITIQLDPIHYPDNNTIVWDSARASEHVEGFEIKRRGNVECDVSIRLEMDHSPERFKLSPALAQVLGVEVDSRTHICAAVWQYIKIKKLQNHVDPTMIDCDAALRRIFGDERIKFASISARLHQHLSPLQPIHLQHRIKVSGSIPAGNACYDVSVNLPAPLLKEMNQFLTNIEKHRDIDLHDDVIENTIRKISEHRRRRAYFLGFSHSPVDFINGLVASQSRDLKMVVGQNNRNAEKERRSDFYNQPWCVPFVLTVTETFARGFNYMTHLF